MELRCQYFKFNLLIHYTQIISTHIDIKIFIRNIQIFYTYIQIKFFNLFKKQ